jgi:pheromone a factor receptor
MGVSSYLLSTALSSNPVLLHLVFTIRAFMKRRKESRDFVTTDSNLTYSYYWRLVALASVDFCFTIPLATWLVVMNAGQGVHPWVSWNNTHLEYSHVHQIPRAVWAHWSPTNIAGLAITQWASVLCAFVFFGFFGFANEAMENYRLLASTIAKRLGCKRISPNSPPDQPLAVSFPMGEAPQIPECATDTPESLYPDNALDQV